MPFIAIRYDLRTAPFAEATHEELYRTCLEQSAWADEHGVADIITLTEHHGMDDGWLPSPVTFAAAVGAVTRNVRIMIAALVFPFHDPVRMAEQIAVADITAGPGRLWLIAGAGYVEWELAMGGIEPKGRGKLVEQAIEVCRRAWTGEPFEHEGRTVRVTPRPVSSPEPMILMGGSSAAAARRAARLRVGFLPAVADPELERIYREAADADGWGGGLVILPQDVGYLFVSEDPERDWDRFEPYLWYEVESYRALQSPDVRSQVSSNATTPAEMREETLFRILTPDDAIAFVTSLGPMGNVVLNPMISGMPPAWGWEGLRLFHEKVLPAVKP
jgi:alkanesulfonate monooxygenase SsuD/methylene tetrahydromethanopterin reductase-like flavin-dependent oxidoreductase (luciferase family)